MAKSVYEASKDIAREGYEFRRGVKEIQAKTERFKRASQWADSSRKAQATAAMAATACAEKIATAAATVRKSTWDAEDVAEKLLEGVRLLEDAVAAGNKVDAEKIVGNMEMAQPGGESTTKQAAEAEMQKLYAFQFPSPLPALVDESEDEMQSDDGQDTD